MSALTIAQGYVDNLFKADFELLEKVYLDFLKKRFDEFRLLHEIKSASDAYVKVGFKNLSHFSTAFKRLFGILPTQVLS